MRRKKLPAQEARSKGKCRNWVLSQVCLTLQAIFFHSTTRSVNTKHVHLLGQWWEVGAVAKPSSLINFFSLLLSALFSVLRWISGLLEQCAYFQGVVQAQHQNDLSSFTPGSAAWHTIAARLFPGRSFSAADTYFSRLDFWCDCDSCVHHSISFLCFTFHSTKLSFMNPFLSVHSKALQGSLSSTRLSLLFIACLLHSGYAKGYTTIAKILMLHPGILR